MFVRELTFLYLFSSQVLCFFIGMYQRIHSKKEHKFPLSHHDATVCSLMRGPLALVAALPQIGHEQKWLYIGHSGAFSKIMSGECIN
jgi:hypothetical protein